MQALEGLLVVSVEQAVAAPFCSARLAQAGARVIKIERDEGDFARGYDTAAKGESSYFTWLSQGKESVCLDFKSDEGAVVLWAMLEKADVFIQNLSPYGAFRCSDDRLILISIQNEREWERLCKEVLQSEPIFQCADYTNNNDRVMHRDQLERDISDITSSMNSTEFQRRLQQARIAYGAINTPDELTSHPAFRTQTGRTAEGQKLQLPAHPVKRIGIANEDAKRSPKLGEHTRSVLDEFGGQKS